MLKVALSIEGVEIPAVCYIVPEKVELVQRLVEKAGLPKLQGLTDPQRNTCFDSFINIIY